MEAGDKPTRKQIEAMVKRWNAWLKPKGAVVDLEDAAAWFDRVYEKKGTR